jgi:hypothetical protein
MSILVGRVRARVAREPIGQRISTRHLRIKRIRIASRDDFVKNIPDRIAI